MRRPPLLPFGSARAACRPAPTMTQAQRLHERGRQPRAARRSDRKDQAPHPRHVRRHGLRLRTASRPRRDQVRARPRRREDRHRRGSNVLCGAIEAAIANGMLAHSDETDDSHAPSRIASRRSVVPAALAAGEQFGIDGTRFLRAVALGYDIGTRVTMTLGAARLSDGDPHQHAQPRWQLSARPRPPDARPV